MATGISAIRVAVKYLRLKLSPLKVGQYPGVGKCR